MTNSSEIQRLEEASKTRADLAAARLASLVTGLLEQVEMRSSALQKDVAEAMGVTPGRVSQLLSGDGNLRIATLARLLDGFGYELSLTATPRDGGEAISVPGRRRRGRRQAASAGTAEALQQEVARLCVATTNRTWSSTEHYSWIDPDFAPKDAAEAFEADVLPEARKGKRATPWRVK